MVTNGCICKQLYIFRVGWWESKSSFGCQGEAPYLARIRNDGQRMGVQFPPPPLGDRRKSQFTIPPPHTWRQNGVFDSQPLLLYPPPLYFHELSSMFNDFLSHGLVIFKQTIIFMRRVGGNENPLRLQRRGGPPARAPWPLTFRFESEPCIQLFCVSWCVGTAMLLMFCCGHRLATLSPKN